MALTACFGLAFAQTPAVPLIFFSRRRYFRWCTRAMGYYLLMLTCLLEDFLGIKIIVTGDDLTDQKKRSMIILNHRTRLDWMFNWLLQSRFGTLKKLKVVLKSELKRIPGPGWAMQHGAYLFLERNWEKDQQTMKSICSYYKSVQTPITLLIFPEGTNLTATTKEKSNNFAAKQEEFNRPYDFCLHPRVTGFTYLLNTMRKNQIIDAVDDVTIAYEGDIPVTELDMLKGRIPRVIHFHVKRHEINELPNTDEEIHKWLQTRWDEKENSLKKFYQENRFDSSNKRLNNEEIESKLRFQRRIACLLWLLFIAFWSYCIIAFIKLKFYVLLVCLFHVIMDTFTNGVIDFVCQLDENSERAQRERATRAIKQN